jgi:Lar family restriction alleviation protein
MKPSQEMPTLLNCPFCGGAAESFNAGGDDVGDYFLVGCKPCGIWHPNTAMSPKLEDAIAAWNTRNP